MKISNPLPSLLLVVLGSMQLLAQGDNVVIPPHKIMSNIYFVGPEAEHSSFLITTSQGLILINSGFERQVPLIRANIEKLGFKYSDIKILLGNHAHVDHQEGDALTKQLTGATVMAMEQDVPALQAMMPGNKAHPVDRVLHDLEEVSLGGTTLVAHLTPGHTKGCTTWTTQAQEDGKTYDVVIGCGIGAGGRALVDNKDYPTVIDDYARTYKLMRTFPGDVFVSSHGGHYGLVAKFAKVGKGPNPYIDPAGFKAHVDEYERQFLEELKKQMQPK